MNSLSWMLYLASAASSLCALSVWAMIFGALTSISLLIHWKWQVDFGSLDQRSAAKTLFSGSLKTSLKVSLVASLVLVFVPDKNTIYAIAASEVGEKVLASKTATKAEAALDAWLDRQLGKPEAKPEK